MVGIFTIGDKEGILCGRRDLWEMPFPRGWGVTRIAGRAWLILPV
jgi:hypothetical protein